MKLVLALLIALSAPAFADGDPNVLQPPGFEHSSTYHIEGQAIAVLCDCEKEEAGTFFIEVTAPFEAPRIAMIAGFDMATRVCVAQGSVLAPDTAALSVVFEDTETAPTRWIIAGNCG